jgi:membrane protein DedA with SNARE-associated domain
MSRLSSKRWSNTKPTSPYNTPVMATWVMSIASSTGYFGILLLMFVENVFPPVPSQVIMPLAGYMAAHGQEVG